MRRPIGWSGAAMLMAALLLAGCHRAAGPTAPAVVRLIPQPPPREGPPPAAAPTPAPAEIPPAPAEQPPAPAPAPAPAGGDRPAPPPEAPEAKKTPAPAAAPAAEKKPAPETPKPTEPGEAKPAPAEIPAAPEPPPAEPRRAPARPGVRGVLDRLLVQNTLQQIGLFYQLYLTEFGRPPARLDDFLDYIKKDGRLEYRALKEGSLVLELTPDPGSNTVLAYEKDPGADGSRMAVMGDTSVQRMSAEEFEKALPKK